MQSVEQVQWPGWDVVRLIGRGSFGAVYEIQRDVFGETERAALKVITIPENSADIEDLRVEGYDDESITSRFHSYLEDIVKEYSTMAKMKGHPNVVYCDDVQYIQHDDGIGWDIYIKMELLTPIMKCLDQVENEQSVLDLGIAMCNALVMCKERSIVHRDIKPQNIFISQDGTFKLGDFGIAKTAERTTSGTKVGTYKYMAPEVYNNRPYGPAADQYSLGLVMYWLLNDRRTPFSPKKATASEEDEARKRRFDGEQIPAPAHGSKQLQAIVLKACAYDPKQRFASASEMLDALRAVKGGTAASAMFFQSGSASSSAAGAASVGIGAVAAGNVLAGEEDLTSRTVGRRPNTSVEDRTVGRKPNMQAISGVGNNGQNNKQFNNTVSSAAVQQQEKKKKRGAATWIAIAAGLIVLIAGVALLAGLGKDKDKGGSHTLDSSKPVETTNIRIDVAETQGSEMTETKTGETLPIQLNWAEWDENLPNYVTSDNYEIEERTLYSSRSLETTSSTTSNKMDGWELYETVESNGEYGDWSKWSTDKISASDTRKVEARTQYRYCSKETTTGSSNSKSGWTLDETTYQYSDYGSWSSWSTEKPTSSDTREVKWKTQYKYREKETYETDMGDISTVYPEWTLDWVESFTTGWSDWQPNYPLGVDRPVEIESRETADGTEYRYKSGWNIWHFYKWNDWTDWSDTAVSQNSNREVTTRTLYRYRDRSKTAVYHFSRWSDWSEWSTTAVSESSTKKVETRTQYRYKDLLTETTYYFQRWSNWSDYSESPVEESETTEVQTKKEYRYKSKATQ